jgi:hypothetical protein
MIRVTLPIVPNAKRTADTGKVYGLNKTGNKFQELVFCLNILNGRLTIA